MTEPSEISALGNVNNVKISDLLAFVVMLLFPLFVFTWKSLVVEVFTSRKFQGYEIIYGGDCFAITLKNQWHFHFHLPLRKTILEQLLSQKKSLQIHEWERYGYSHLFSMNWKKTFLYIRKPMGTSFPYLGIVWFV